jgi:hypothetical protein
MNTKILSTEARIASLIADEAKNAAMLEQLLATITTLRAKNSFRLALLNQMREQLSNQES